MFGMAVPPHTPVVAKIVSTPVRPDHLFVELRPPTDRIVPGREVVGTYQHGRGPDIVEYGHQSVRERRLARPGWAVDGHDA